MKDKLIAYLGFARKSGNLIFGVDNCIVKSGKIFMIIIDSKLADNSKKKVSKIIEAKPDCDMLTINNLDEVLGTTNCKAIGIASNDLANAIRQLYKKEVQN